MNLSNLIHKLLTYLRNYSLHDMTYRCAFSLNNGDESVQTSFNIYF